MIKAKVKQQNREKVPSGTHIARCYSMVHIGTVTWEYLGEVISIFSELKNYCPPLKVEEE